MGKKITTPPPPKKSTTKNWKENLNNFSNSLIVFFLNVFFRFFYNLKELNIILVGWGITIKYFTLTSLKDRARKVYKNIARTLLRVNSVLILSLNFHILIIIAFHIMFGGTMPIFCSRCKIHFFWFIFIIILGNCFVSSDLLHSECRTAGLCFHDIMKWVQWSLAPIPAPSYKISELW